MNSQEYEKHWQNLMESIRREDEQHQTRYDQQVSDADHELAYVHGSGLAGEILKLLMLNPNVCARLNFTDLDISALAHLQKSLRNKTLTLSEAKPIAFEANKPYLALDFVASSSRGEVETHIIGRWTADGSNNPYGATLYHSDLLHDSNTITFLTLPPQEVSAESVSDYLLFNKADGEELVIMVATDQSWFRILRQGQHQGKQITTISTYHRIGTINGELTEATYQLYGCNEKFDSLISITPLPALQQGTLNTQHPQLPSPPRGQLTS